MVFSYYNRLSARQQSIYRQSDEIKAVKLPRPADIRPYVVELEPALKSENRREVGRLCQGIDGKVAPLEAPPVGVEVLAARQSDDWGELHGLYEPAEGRRRARITVWMRTSRHKKVVAFRTFLRTILHEICHHLDYELLELADSFHTEGFFQRESSLFHQLMKAADP